VLNEEDATIDLGILFNDDANGRLPLIMKPIIDLLNINYSSFVADTCWLFWLVAAYLVSQYVGDKVK
jgi:hypothetical protein